MGARADRAALILLYAGAALLPIVFWPWAADPFVDLKFLTMCLITGTAAIAAGVSLVSARRTVAFRFADWAAVAFVAISAIGLGLSIDPWTSLLGEPLQRAGFLMTLGLIGGYAAARLTIRSHERFIGLLFAVVTGATLVAIYGVIQLAGADMFWTSLPRDRVFSSVGQPNWLGAYLVVSLPLTAVLGITFREAVLRLGLAISAVLQMIVLLGTRSRASWLGLVAVVVVASILHLIRSEKAHRLKRRGPVLASVILVIGVVIGMVGLGGMRATMSPSSLVDRAVSAFDTEAFDVRQHLALWSVAGAVIADHPLFGTGPDTFALVFPSYRDEVLDPYFAEYLSAFRPESPHNVYLATAAGAGLPALLAYGLFLGAVLTALVLTSRAKGRSSLLLVGVIAAVAGHAVTDAFMTIDLATSWIFWTLLGAGMAIHLAIGEGDAEVSVVSQPGEVRKEQAETAGIRNVE